MWSIYEEVRRFFDQGLLADAFKANSRIQFPDAYISAFLNDIRVGNTIMRSSYPSELLKIENNGRGGVGGGGGGGEGTIPAAEEDGEETKVSVEEGEGEEGALGDHPTTVEEDTTLTMGEEEIITMLGEEDITTTTEPGEEDLVITGITTALETRAIVTVTTVETMGDED